MAKFRYQAQDKHGRTVSGEIEAGSRIQASLKLRQQELWITRMETGKERPLRIRLSAARERAPGDWVFNVWPVPAAHLGMFFEQLAALAQAGINAYSAMGTLAHQVPWRMRRMVAAMAPPLAQGEPIADQMEHYPHVFAPSVVAMVRAGERTGSLPQLCRLVADQYGADQQVSRSLIFTRVHAWAVVILCVLVPWFPLFLNNGLGWYLHLLWTVLLPVIGGLILLDLAFRTVLRQTWFAGVRQDVLSSIPGTAGYMRSGLYARVLAVLEAMVRTGAPSDEALAIAAAAAGPCALGRQLRRASEQVRAGMPLGQALERCRRLPYTMRAVMQTAEVAGAQEQTLARLAQMQREELVAFPRRMGMSAFMVSLIPLSILTLIALYIGFMNYYNALFAYADKIGQ